MAEEKYERYCSIEESIIQSCKEVNLMRKGLMPKRTLAELWAELDKVLDEELNEDDFVEQPKRKVVARA